MAWTGGSGTALSLTRKACRGGMGGGERSGLEWPLSRGWGGHGPVLGSCSLLFRDRRGVWGEDRGPDLLEGVGSGRRERCGVPRLRQGRGLCPPGSGPLRAWEPPSLHSGLWGDAARDGDAASETPGLR